MSAAVSSTWAARVPLPGEPLLVGAEEVALADRGGRLQLVHRPRADRQPHQPHAARDRARGDHHDPLSAALQRGDLLADRSRTSARSSPSSGATIEEPSLTTRVMAAKCRSGGRSLPAPYSAAKASPSSVRFEHAELLVDVAQVGLDRLRGDEEALGDLAVAHPLDSHPGNPHLARGQ